MSYRTKLALASWLLTMFVGGLSGWVGYRAGYSAAANEYLDLALAVWRMRIRDAQERAHEH